MEEKIIVYLITTLLSTVIGYLTKTVRERGEELQQQRIDNENLRAGVQAILRRALRQDGEKYIAQGYCTLLQKQDFDNTYQRYHALYENGVMSGFHKEVMALPIEPTEYQ